MELKSLKSLYLESKYNDLVIARATGFIIEHNNKFYLITNRHVVTGKNNQTNECMDRMGALPNKIRVVIPIIEENGARWTSMDVDLYDENEEKKWLEHPTFEGNVDVVALELLDFEYKCIEYSIAYGENLSVTDNVYIIGYPFGYSVLPGDKKVAIWTAGSVASEPELGVNINGVQLPAFLVDSKTRTGQSGSPVVYHNNNGFVRTNNGLALRGGPVSFNVGIYSGRINNESDLGYVWKWSVIEEILNNNSEIQQLN